MRLVRFDGWKTGLLVETSKGPCVVDVASSIRILPYHCPLSGHISAGLISGILADDGRGSWLPLIERWAIARIGMAQLAALASRFSGLEGLIMYPLETVPLEPQNAALTIEIDKVGLLAAQHALGGVATIQSDEL